MLLVLLGVGDVGVLVMLLHFLFGDKLLGQGVRGTFALVGGACLSGEVREWPDLF